MAQLHAIDNIDNHNDLLIALGSELAKERFNKEFLIREMFALWYILVEGIECEDFNENLIHELLLIKYKLVQEMFGKFSDFNFLIGWMLTIAPWWFNNNLSEDDGYRFLYKAYKANSRNHLYKWALRDQVRLRDDEIQKLNNRVKENFSSYFDHGLMIKGYFISILK